MKKFRKTIFIAAITVTIYSCIILVVMSVYYSSNNLIEVAVDLPEEYILITEDDNLQGRYDSVENKLYIWFNNEINK